MSVPMRGNVFVAASCALARDRGQLYGRPGHYLHSTVS